MVVYPGLLLVLLALFSRLQLETAQGSASLTDTWLTGMAVLVVALGNGHAFLATIATYKSTGVLKQLSVVPVSPVQLIAGEVIPRAVMGMITVVAFLALGRVLGAHVRVGPDLVAVIPLMAIVATIGLTWAFVIAGMTSSPQDANALDSYINQLPAVPVHRRDVAPRRVSGLALTGRLVHPVHRPAGRDSGRGLRRPTADRVRDRTGDRGRLGGRPVRRRGARLPLRALRRMRCATQFRFSARAFG